MIELLGSAYHLREVRMTRDSSGCCGESAVRHTHRIRVIFGLRHELRRQPHSRNQRAQSTGNDVSESRRVERTDRRVGRLLVNAIKRHLTG